MNKQEYDETIEAVVDRAIESLEADFGNEWWDDMSCTISVTVEEELRDDRISEVIGTPKADLRDCGDVLELSDNVGADPSWRTYIVENEDITISEAIQFMAFSAYRQDVVKGLIDRLDQREGENRAEYRVPPEKAEVGDRFYVGGKRIGYDTDEAFEVDDPLTLPNDGKKEWYVLALEVIEENKLVKTNDSFLALKAINMEGEVVTQQASELRDDMETFAERTDATIREMLERAKQEQEEDY